VPGGGSAGGETVVRRDVGQRAATLRSCSDTPPPQDCGVGRLGDRRVSAQSHGVGGGRRWRLRRWKAPNHGRGGARAPDCGGATPPVMTRWGEGGGVPRPHPVRRRPGRHPHLFMGCCARVLLDYSEGWGCSGPIGNCLPDLRPNDLFTFIYLLSAAPCTFHRPSRRAHPTTTQFAGWRSLYARGRKSRSSAVSVATAQGGDPRQHRGKDGGGGGRPPAGRLGGAPDGQRARSMQGGRVESREALQVVKDSGRQRPADVQVKAIPLCPPSQPPRRTRRCRHGHRRALSFRRPAAGGRARPL